MIQYWKFRDKVPKKDAKGNVVLDSKGKKILVEVKLDKPKVFSAVVFNGEQIKGLPPLEKKEPAWDRHQRAEAILVGSGAEINHDQANRAFYRPTTDSIHLPGRSQFNTADRYYATALHELGHWTGHPTRLHRDLSGSFGSDAYAKEELRAEIASLMIGDELGVGHDPGQHAAYVKSWIKVLKEDPKEILRAAKDADSIASLALSYEQTNVQATDKNVEKPLANRNGHHEAVARPSRQSNQERFQTPQEGPESIESGITSTLSLKLAEKVATGFKNEADRARFLERVQTRMAQDAKVQNADICIKEAVAFKEDKELER